MPTPLFRRRSYLPYFLELVARLIARVLYRVRTKGLEQLPKSGGVLLISNHISYVDVVVLQLVCPRPIRFLGYRGLRRNWFFNWCFDMSGCLTIAPEHPMEGIRAAVRALKRGEMVCEFDRSMLVMRRGNTLEARANY